jgi:hypothetical protein
MSTENVCQMRFRHPAPCGILAACILASRTN